MHHAYLTIYCLHNHKNLAIAARRAFPCQLVFNITGGGVVEWSRHDFMIYEGGDKNNGIAR